MREQNLLAAQCVLGDRFLWRAEGRGPPENRRDARLIGRLNAAGVIADGGGGGGSAWASSFRLTLRTSFSDYPPCGAGNTEEEGNGAQTVANSTVKT